MGVGVHPGESNSASQPEQPADGAGSSAPPVPPGYPTQPPTGSGPPDVPRPAGAPGYPPLPGQPALPGQPPGFPPGRAVPGRWIGYPPPSGPPYLAGQQPRWVPQPPAGIPALPRPPRSRRRWVIVGIAGALALLVCAGGITAAAIAVVRHSRAVAANTPSGLTTTAADAIAKLPAVHAALDFVDVDGRTIHADLTVTATGDASGTITDPSAGTADVLVSSGTTLVRGDRDWWARRAPKSVSAFAGTWIRPKPGVVFPFDLAVALKPAALADLTRKVAAAAQSGASTDTVSGAQVRTIVSGDWTALVSADASHRLLWLGGPVRAGALARPSVRATGPGRLLPAYLADPAPPLPVGRPPYVSITPTPGQPQGVQAAIANVLPPASPPAAGASGLPTSGPLPSQGQPGAAAPAQADVAPKFAAFELTINATDCYGAVCSWTVSVTNSGDAPGEATVYASAVPGMPLASVPLGNLAPGQTAVTRPMTFGNPAPPPRPGQTTQVTISYQAWVYSATLLGPDPARAQNLRNRGIDPDTDIPQIDPGYMPTVLGALDLMTQQAPGGQANQAALTAVNDAITAGMLPDLKALVDSGRLSNPQDLAQKLIQARSTTTTTGPDGTIGYRREIEQAATILRQDPTAQVILDGYLPNAQTGGKDGADILDTTNKRAYQLKAVTSGKVRPAITTAIGQLNGAKGVDGSTGVRQQAPPGYAKIALIYVEPTSPLRDKSKDEWQAFLRGSQNLGLCDASGTPTIDRLVIVAAQGTFDWPKEQFGVFGAPCR